MEDIYADTRIFALLIVNRTAWLCFPIIWGFVSKNTHTHRHRLCYFLVWDHFAFGKTVVKCASVCLWLNEWILGRYSKFYRSAESVIKIEIELCWYSPSLSYSFSESALDDFVVFQFEFKCYLIKSTIGLFQHLSLSITNFSKEWSRKDFTRHWPECKRSVFHFGKHQSSLLTSYMLGLDLQKNRILRFAVLSPILPVLSLKGLKSFSISSLQLIIDGPKPHLTFGLSKTQKWHFCFFSLLF